MQWTENVKSWIARCSDNMTEPTFQFSSYTDSVCSWIFKWVGENAFRSTSTWTICCRNLVSWKVFPPKVLVCVGQALADVHWWSRYYGFQPNSCRWLRAILSFAPQTNKDQCPGRWDCSLLEVGLQSNATERKRPWSVNSKDVHAKQL